MKILNVISFGFETGGAESYVQETSSLLRDRGHEVVTLASDAGPDLLRFDQFQFRSLPTRGVKKLVYTLYNPYAGRTTQSVLKSFQPDVVVLHTLDQATPSTVFALRGVPTVVCVHGPEQFTLALLPWILVDRDFRDGSHNLGALTWRGRLHYFYFRFLSRPLWRTAFRHIATMVAYSTYMTDLLNAEGFSAEYVPMGMALFAWTPPDPDSRHVLFVGRLVAFKGILVLLEAFKEVARAVPGATLTIAGDGEMRGELEEVVGREGLEESVRFLGHVRASDMAGIYAEASVVVTPSLVPESFGKVGVEAMSVGRPVVVSDVGGVRDWLDPGVNGLLVRPGESGEVAAALIELLDDPDRMEQMGRKAHESVQRFSLDLHVIRLEKVLEGARDQAG
jgi:glycosyltransferase involved in cell wall biosynthesis